MRYRFQQFISDISGQDVAAHGNDAAPLIGTVRDWLSTASGGAPRPGGAAIARRFDAFMAELPEDCARLHLRVDDLTFADYASMVRSWLTQQST